MAEAEKTPQAVDECRPSLVGLATNLLVRRYGPAGPPWGTSFTALERLATLLAAVLRQAFLDLALSRQATTFLQSPPAG
jgi:hypothetical protein